MKTLTGLILACMLCVTAGTTLAAETGIPADRDVISFDTKLGVVTFLHRMHAELASTECTTCHHTWDGSAPVKPCHECHDKQAAETPEAKKIFHARCIGCHEYTVAGGQQAGPLKKKCKLCHVKQ